MIPPWFAVLEATTRHICRERRVDYVNATAEEIAPIHAEAERRLGAAFVRLVEKARKQ